MMPWQTTVRPWLNTLAWWLNQVGPGVPVCPVRLYLPEVAQLLSMRSGATSSRCRVACWGRRHRRSPRAHLDLRGAAAYAVSTIVACSRIVGYHKLIMPLRGKGGRTIRCNVGSLLDECSEMHELISIGVFSSDTGNAKARASRIAALRCVDKGFRTHLDELIRKWMRDTMELLEVQRQKQLVLYNRQRTRTMTDIAEGNAPQNTELDHFMTEVTASKEITVTHLSRFFSQSAVDAIVSAISTGERGNSPNGVGTAVMALKPTVLTFMCISLSRCQVHGPMGQTCRRPRCGKHVFGDNYSMIGGNNRVCLHANQKCVESVCVLQEALDGKQAEPSNSWMAFRSMLRMSDVHYPFDIHDVLRKLKESPLYEDAYADSASILPWPGIPVFSHPMWGGAPSAQDLLGLSEEQVKLCSEDAERKAMQVHVRAREIRDITLRQLREDVDAMVKYNNKIPFTSLRNMASACVGAERTIDAAIRGNANVKHGQDIRFARDAISTAGFFLHDVFDYQSTKMESVSTSEAYDFVSGLHIGLYGTCCPAWKRYYGTLKTTITFPIDKLSVAMQFFDSIKSDSLVRRGQCTKITTNIGSVKIILPSRDMVMEGYFTSLITSLEFLVKHYHNNDLEEGQDPIEIPHLAMSRSRPSDSDYEKWAYGIFKLLAGYPWLRCGALDVLGMDSCRLVQSVTLA